MVPKSIRPDELSVCTIKNLQVDDGHSRRDAEIVYASPLLQTCLNVVTLCVHVCHLDISFIFFGAQTVRLPTGYLIIRVGV